MNGQADHQGARIVLAGIQKRFGNVVAVDNLRLDIRPSEFITLLGPSGCGKTTTLRMIGGFEYPTSGSILIDGTDVAMLPPHRRPVNTVFQQYALFPHMSVGRNVGYGLAMARIGGQERKRRVAEALEMVRLPHVEDRKPSQLSGGQQQRVALARALVNRPKALLLDEPLGALDLKLRKAMQLELKTLNREVGATFVYVTHDQEEALTMSDRIAVMNNGRILQLGTPEEIYERPVSRFVADFIGQSNLLAGAVQSVDGQIARVEIDGVGVLQATLPSGVGTGMPVHVAVRPERITFGLLDGNGVPVNVLSGTVADLVYLGSHVQARVRLRDGSDLLANAYEAPPAAGSRVEISFAAEHAVVLLDD
jgi:spermidine/putrescine transport system ATP-binding protein